MKQLSTNELFGQPTSRGKFPTQAQYLKIVLDYSDGSTDISGEIPITHGVANVAGIDNVQSFVVDNSGNGQPITFVFSNGFEFTCPQYAQGVFPIFYNATAGLKFVASTTGGVKVNVFLTNTREVPAIWTTKIPLAGTVNISGSSVFTQPLNADYTDQSGTLAVGGTSQVLIAANGARKGFMIRNPSSAAAQGIAAAESVFLNFGAAAALNGASSWELLPGESLTSQEIGLCTTQAINWIAATTGHLLTCKEM